MMKCITGLIRIDTAEAWRFIVECLQAAGANRLAAEQQADLVIQADIYGHPSEGINRLAMYVKDIKSGVCKPNNRPEILKETHSTAWIDGKNVLGATVSHLAMNTAICKAIATGIGWVTVKGSNHNGIAGFWAQKAACRGLIGIALTNSAPVLVPTRSKQTALGANPIAVAALGSDCELFYLDMATTAVALGKVEMQRRKDKPLPAGCAQGPDGKETKNAELVIIYLDTYRKAFKTMHLLPLGGSEETSGYKGFGLAAMVELFCGICAGSSYGHHISPRDSLCPCKPADLGHCFGAINPHCFAPGFCERLTDCIRHWRKLEPVDPCYPVLAPGDKEGQAAYISYVTGAVAYTQAQINACAVIASKLNVKPMELASK